MRPIRQGIDNPLYWLVPFAIWSQLVIASAWWSVHGIEARAEAEAAQRGRDLFMMIELTRAWNASHGGIYAVRSERAQPNPHLDTPNRDLTTQQGLALTMIDPAYMARQISELARSRDIRFHVTSNDPLRPANAPDAWERRALDAFEHGEHERIELVGGKDGAAFRYMAPLKVEPTCLGCHAAQGYQLGDIRGGISVDVDAAPILAARDAAVTRTVVGHAVVWAAVSILIFMNMRSLRRGMLRMAATQRAQARTIAQKDRALTAAKHKLQDMRRKDPLTGFFNREYFERALQEALDKAEARAAAYGLMIVELDYFKEFNDQHGILEGDIVIRMVGEVLTKAASQDGTLFGRYIGSSFALGIDGIEPRALARLGESIRRDVFELGIKHEQSDAAGFVTATVGSAYKPADHPGTAASLLKQAAVAMFEGKRQGRNCVVNG